MTPRLANPLKAAALAVVLLGGAMSAPVVEAAPRVRVWVGGPFWWPGYWPGYWGPPYVVERPVIVQPPAEPLVVQPAQQAHLWYYCHEAQMYYPYVTTCPSAWQEVPATPAPAAPAATQAPATAASGPVPSLAPVPAAAEARRTAPAPVPPRRAASN